MEAIHLCSDCILADECLYAKEYPILDCEFFDDGYEGPEYYDGDAWRKWIDVTLFGMEAIGHDGVSHN